MQNPPSIIPPIRVPSTQTGQEDLTPVSTSQARLVELALKRGTCAHEVLDELRDVSIAAAAHGQFKPAIDGLAKVAEGYGVLNNATPIMMALTNPTQVKEASKETLEERRQVLKDAIFTIEADPDDAEGYDDL